MLTAKAPEYYQHYYIDSGASNHFVGDADTLIDFNTFAKPIEVRTAHGRSLWATGSGTLRFTTLAGGKEKEGELEDVHYVPGLEERLISLGKLVSQGWDPRLGFAGISVCNNKGISTIYAPMINNTYTALLHPIPPDVGLSARNIPDDELQRPLTALLTKEKAKPVSLYDWHRRMGHPHQLPLVKMAQGAVTGMALVNSPGNSIKLSGLPDLCTHQIRAPSFYGKTDTRNGDSPVGSWRSRRPDAGQIDRQTIIRIYISRRLFEIGMDAPVEGEIGRAHLVSSKSGQTS